MRVFRSILFFALYATLFGTGYFWLRSSYPIITSVLAGTLGAIILFGIISPLLKEVLVNDPDRRYAPYLFTEVEYGQVKNVVRGGPIVRYLMEWGGHKFARLGPSDEDRHWEVVAGTERNYLLTLRPWNPLSWYIYYMYHLTGVMWVGIWPFQRLKMYRLPRLVPADELQSDARSDKTDARGQPDLAHLQTEDSLRLKEKDDWSDHVRVREFIWFVEISSADTQERIPLRLHLALRLMVVNPQKAFYATDNWNLAINNAITNRVTSVLRTLPLDRVLTAKEGEHQILAESLRGINDRMEGASVGDGTEARFGIRVIEVQLRDIHPLLDEEGQRGLTAKWRAEQERQAIVTRGRGEAERGARIIRAESAAVAKAGEAGTAVLTAQQKVDMARAAGSTVIFDGSGEDRTNKAILTELRSGNRSQQGRVPHRGRPDGQGGQS